MTTPYVLAVASHKGGTGRTTTALALAWTWGQAGKKVVLLDADPIRAASLVAADPTGKCPWPNVTLRTGMLAETEPLPDADVIVIDTPALTEASSRAVLKRANGIVLACLADPISLRTVPAAASAIEKAWAENPKLELLGIQIGIFNPQEPTQSAMLARLIQAHGAMVLQPPIPLQVEVRNWPAKPGARPPTGPAIEAFAALARNLDAWVSRS